MKKPQIIDNEMWLEAAKKADQKAPKLLIDEDDVIDSMKNISHLLPNEEHKKLVLEASRKAAKEAPTLLENSQDNSTENSRQIERQKRENQRSKIYLDASKKAARYPEIRPDNSAQVIDSKRWLELAKNSRQSPQVRPDHSTHLIDSKRWIELNRQAAQKAPPLFGEDKTENREKGFVKKVIQISQIVGVSGLFIFLVLLVTVETVYPGEPFARDILGFSIPDSGIFFFFSLHGIIITIVGALLFYIVKLFMNSNKGSEQSLK